MMRFHRNAVGTSATKSAPIHLVIFCGWAAALTLGCHASPQDPMHAPPPMPDASEPEPNPPSACKWEAYDQGLTGGAVNLVTADQRTPGRLYAAAGRTLHLSDDLGRSWRALGEAPSPLRAVTFPTGDDEAVVAATGKGLIRSDDEGATWTAHALDGLNLTEIHGHPGDSRLVFATGPRLGILRSVDSGSTWSGANDGVTWSEIHQFSGDPQQPSVALAISTRYADLLGGPTPEQGVVLRSVNAGISWQAVWTTTRLNAVARCPTDSEIVWVAGNSGLSASYDGGSSWSAPIEFGAPVSDVAVGGPACQRILAYVVAGGSAVSGQVGVHLSDDGGVTWSGPHNDGIRQSSRPGGNGLMFAGPHDVAITYGGQGAYRSESPLTEGWAAMEPLGRLPFRLLAAAPGQPQALWLGTWGNGAWFRPSAHDDWNAIAFDQLPESHTIAIAPLVNSPGKARIGGWIDLWQPSDSEYQGSGLGEANVFDMVTDDEDRLQLVATQTQGVLSTEDNGATWTEFNGGLAPWNTVNGHFIDVRQIVRDSDTGQTLIGTEGRGIYTLTADDSWAAVSAPAIAGSMVRRLLLTGRYVLALMDGRGLAIAARGTTSFTQFNDGLPSLGLGDVAFDDDSGLVFVSTSAGVFRRSADSDSEPWQPLGNNCLAAPPGQLAVIGARGTRWLVATTSGGHMQRYPIYDL